MISVKLLMCVELRDSMFSMLCKQRELRLYVYSYLIHRLIISKVVSLSLYFVLFVLLLILDQGSVEMPDIEPETVGVWDDTRLDAIDQLMTETKSRSLPHPYFLILAYMHLRC